MNHGKDAKIYANGVDLSPFLDSIDNSGTSDVAEVSTFGTVQKPYIAGFGDGTMSMEGFYDGSVSAAETALATALGNTAVITWYPAGDAVANYGFGMEADGTAKSVRATLDGASRITAAMQSSTGMEPVICLHAMGKEYSAVFTGTIFNFSAASTSGGSAYLQVISAVTTAALSIHQSQYASFSADDTELVAFTAVTGGRTAERKAITGAIKQYVRAYANITAGETVTFNIGIYRK